MWFIHLYFFGFFLSTTKSRKSKGQCLQSSTNTSCQTELLVNLFALSICTKQTRHSAHCVKETIWKNITLSKNVCSERDYRRYLQGMERNWWPSFRRGQRWSGYLIGGKSEGHGVIKCVVVNLKKHAIDTAEFWWSPMPKTFSHFVKIYPQNVMYFIPIFVWTLSTPFTLVILSKLKRRAQMRLKCSFLAVRTGRYRKSVSIKGILINNDYW